MKTAIFPGSFDPITKAHMDLIERASRLFDQVYICVGINAAKKTLLTAAQREDLLQRIFKEDARIQVSSYTGLTVDYAREVQADAIIRGLRGPQDFEYERPIAQNNQQLNPRVETLFLISRPEFSHISSTIVREIHQYGGGLDHLVPPEVLEVLSSM